MGISIDQAAIQCPEPGCEGVLRRRESTYGFFYGCTRWPHTKCPGSHPADEFGNPIDKPPATKALRTARRRAHDALDPLWQEAEDPKRARSWAYEWLASQLGMAPDVCHIGKMDEDQCARVESACSGVTFREVEAWFWEDRDDAVETKADPFAPRPMPWDDPDSVDVEGSDGMLGMRPLREYMTERFERHKDDRIRTLKKDMGP